MTKVVGLASRSTPRTRVLVAIAAAVVGLSACSSTATSTDSGAKPAAKPSVDVLRIAAADATNTTGLDPRSVSAGASSIVAQHVFDSVVTLEGKEYKLKLAESVEPNADATMWTVKLRKGVQFHDGKPVRAADVAFSLTTLAAPPSNRASVYADVDAAKIKVVDDSTLEVPLKRARADFKESVLAVFSVVFPEGTTDFAKPIGSGPYKFETSDQRIVRLVANEQYWGGKPAIPALEIDRIASPAARLAALKDGQVDYAVGISAAGAQTEKGNTGIKIQRGGVANSNALSFAMNQNLAPFNDPKVRKAVRLAADRPALVAQALMGYGAPGEDVVGKDLPGYNAKLTERKRDLEEARKLFREAGVTELTLRAADVVPGMLPAAKLFAQQLEEAGVKLAVQEVPADSYYSDLKGLATHPFQVFYYVNRPAALHLAAVTNEKAVFNVTGAGQAHWSRLAEAQVLVDPTARANAFDAIEQDFYDNGGDLVWGFQEQLDATRAGVEGVRLSQSVQLFDQAKATKG
ncbi:ABC transporter substrate-binding protein [Kitasatospora sp. NPDC056327]|uniref:ABC transporter substrate-binding protein n=1 Tax=Kitasatospora sp. NPDC056327 TaxID=3345785 RepID=UPI0035D9F22D